MLRVSYSVPAEIFKLDAAVRLTLSEAAGQGALAAVRLWYQQLPASWFDGPNHPDGRPRTFVYQLANGWDLATVTQDSATIRFSPTTPPAYGLALHQYGGTIVPKRAKALTIPVDPQAHGLSAREYAASVHQIFYVRRKDNTNTNYVGSLCYKDPSGALHAAFVLHKSATIKPLRDREGREALPPDDDIAKAACKSLGIRLKPLIEQGVI